MSFGKRWKNLNPYDLHKSLINEYFLTTKNKISLLERDKSRDKRDIDVIRENHQFLWENDDEESQNWGKKLAKKYYDKLFKEYCIGDMSMYKENKIGLRWRTEQELIDGKGQFSCGSKKCQENTDLKTWEVNFGYVEHGIKKNALIKLRLCPGCSYKLNYHHKRKEVKRLSQNFHNLRGQKSSLKKVKNGDNDKKKVEIQKPDFEKVQSEDTSNNTSFSEEQRNDNDIWKQTNLKEDEKSREDEFNEYLDQLFL